jgi:hypothetical protein
MKKQENQNQTVDLDSFEDVSIYQLIPSGTGMGQSHLKTLVDSQFNGSANLKSILIVGKEGASTHGSAFIRALGIDNYHQIDGSMLCSASGLHQFFYVSNYEAYLITSAEKLSQMVHLSVCNILRTQQFSIHNYLKECPDIFVVPGLVVMTTNNIKKIADPILSSIDHIVELEDYTPTQLELIILQRLKYAHIEHKNDCILKNIVRYGNNNLAQSIRFLRLCIAVMQADGRQVLIPNDVMKASRLNRLPSLPGDDIPF